MTDLIVLGGSLAVIGAMLAAAFLLGFRHRRAIATDADVQAIAREAEPDASVESTAIDPKGRAALARLSDGRLLAVRAIGDGVSVRSFASSAVRLRLAPHGVIATFGEVGYPRLDLALDLKTTPPWLLELAEGAGGKA